ncbi:MAG: ATP-binding cassette domain-containing protein [Pirellulales bacterium]
MISAQNAGRRGDHDRWIARGINLTLREADRIAVVGPTGSGKTVLLRALATLDSLDEGEILWQERPVANADVPQFRAAAVYLRQRPAVFDGTVETICGAPFGSASTGTSGFDRDQVVAQLATVSRSADFLGQDVRDLSGGETQLVALMRALQLAPTVLLLDEPTASLDDATTSQAESLIAQWFAESATSRAYIWVTHGRAQAERVATTQWQMQDGRLTTDATGELLLNDADNA